MKGEIFIIFASILMVLGGTFLFFNVSPSFTGFAVYDEFSDYSIANSSVVVTREMALSAIDDSYKLMDEMNASGFSVEYINDTILDAERFFTQVNYADILRGGINATEKEKLDAKNALKLVKWKNITYGDVLNYTERIKVTRDKAYLLRDKISIEEKMINQYRSKLSLDTLETLNQAKMAFNEERYNDAEIFIEAFKISSDKEKAQFSGLNDLRNNSIGFIQRYWIYIIFILVILAGVIYFIYRKLEIQMLKKRISKMKTEQIALTDLMKKLQVQRFKENDISELVYTIRMKRYQERIQEIKQKLPVLEIRLKRMINKL